MEKEKNKVLNPVMARLLDFAESHGGFATIGRKIGKHPSMFYNLVRRNAVPSLATLQDIAEGYPEIDLNYIIRGNAHTDVRLISELQEKVKSYESALLRTINLPGKHKGAQQSPGHGFDNLTTSANKFKTLSGNSYLYRPVVHPVSVQ